MAEKTIKTRIIHKHDTEAHWNSATNFIPKQGEIIIYDIDSIYDYERFKIGDGETVVASLPFATDSSLPLSGGTLTGRLEIDQDASSTMQLIALNGGSYLRNYEDAKNYQELVLNKNSLNVTRVVDGTATNYTLATKNDIVQSDWEQVDETKADYIKNKIPLENGSGENSIQSVDSVALSANSVAEGTSNYAGSKAFLITAYNVATKTFTLDSVEGLTAFKAGENGGKDTPGDTYSCQMSYNYDLFGQIESIDETVNIVVVDVAPEEIINDVYVLNTSSTYDSSTTYYTYNSGEYKIYTYSESNWNENYASLYLLTQKNITQEAITNGKAYFYIPGKPEVGTEPWGTGAHAEGYGNYAVSIGAHAEGYNNISAGKYSHTEGRDNITSYAAHAEGQGNKATGQHSHAEGHSTISTAVNSHAEGLNTQANGDNSHTEGSGTITHQTAYNSHAEGSGSQVKANAGHAEGDGCIVHENAEAAHAEGKTTNAHGSYSHTEGLNTTTYGGASHAEGYDTTTTASCAHAEGLKTHAEGQAAHSEGYGTEANGKYAHSEGYATYANGEASHAEGGRDTTANGAYSHAEGESTYTKNIASHSEGAYTAAEANYSHAEGFNTKASGVASHTEGEYTFAGGTGAHAEGQSTQVSGNYCHGEGIGIKIMGNATARHVQGKYNTIDWSDTYAHVVGNGSAAVTDADGNVTKEEVRSNAHTLTWTGNAWYAGSVTAGRNTTDSDGDLVLVTKGYLKSYIESAVKKYVDEVILGGEY